MEIVPGYKIEDQLYKGDCSLVYRGYKESTWQRVILKVLNKEYPSPGELSRFKREYEITSDLHLEGVIEIYSLEKYKNTLFMVEEDFGGESLDCFLAANRPPVVDLLAIAVRITEALGRIHGSNIMHKDINPSNIIFNPETGKIAVIDFGIATDIPKETQEVRNPDILEGSLLYMSPEQTGRMNRAVDHRSDFYSLGVTIYRMLTGKLPFQSNDTMGLIHCHMAIVPDNPAMLNPGVPPELSDIVMKLLSKNAEDRYESAFGISSDLEYCLSRLRSGEDLKGFEIGRNDVLGKFQLSQKMYGREKEIEILIKAVENACMGVKKVLFVVGESGIGKSDLAHEIHKFVVERKGYFCSGEFSGIGLNSPYTALINAFQELISQLLTETEEKVRAWKDALSSTLWPNGKLITDIIPKLELFIGPQPLLEPLPAAEAQNRFNITFQKFVEAFAGEQHPLVIFLDDLQWADSASMNLIEALIRDLSLKHLLIIGAYRNDDVDASHPLALMEENIRSEGQMVEYLNLEPLTSENLNDLISDTFQCQGIVSKPLAELVLKKTRGNPFIVNKLLHSLHQESLIRFDTDSERWHWDIEKIEGSGITGNPVNLMKLKIQKLSTNVQELLKSGACLGSRFDLNNLAMVQGKPPFETAKDLREAVNQGMISFVGQDYKSIQGKTVKDQDDTSSKLPELVYQFYHDKVYQAAYSLMSEEEKQARHLRIGKLFMERFIKDDEKIFTIADQLNRVMERFNTTEEKKDLAVLNLRAGKKAMASSAYGPALNYLSMGIRILGPGQWQNQYSLAIDLHREAVKAAYSNLDFKKMENLSGVLLKNGKSLDDKLEVYEIRIKGYSATNQPQEAIKEGLAVLNMLGCRLPSDPNKIDLIWKFLKTRFVLKGIVIDKLKNKKDMADPNILAICRILPEIGTSAYRSKPNLLPLIVMQGISLFLKHGNAPESSFFMAAYGMILCGALEDIETGYSFGELASAMMERANAYKFKARSVFLVQSMIIHWKHHIRETLAPLLVAYRLGLDTGDIEYAADSLHLYCLYSYFSGNYLTEVGHDTTEHSAIIRQYRQKTYLNYNDMLGQVISNLMECPEDPCVLKGKYYNEEEMLKSHIKADDGTAIYLLYFHKMILMYLFGRLDEALKYSEMAEEYAENVISLFYLPVYHFFDSLVRLAGFHNNSTDRRKKDLKRIKTNQKKLKKWAGYAPMNHMHRYYLVEAEKARVMKHEIQAIEYYQLSIRLAKENEFFQDETIALECLGKFWVSKGVEELGRIYLMEAGYKYELWGASTKADKLKKQWNELFTSSKAVFPEAVFQTSLDKTIRGDILDVETMVSASQAVAGEIDLGKMLKKLMEIVLISAGAQRGLFVVKRDGRYLIEAEAVVGKETPLVLQSIPIESDGNGGKTIVPERMIRYVSRSCEAVVFDKIGIDRRFIDDPYIKENSPGSILCQPIIYQGSLSGILYLENMTTSGAFTPDRLQLLKVLSSQAAISIENARLFGSLEEKHKLLGKKEEQFRNLFENSNDAIFIFRYDGSILDANSRACEMLGYSYEDILGKRIRAIVPEAGLKPLKKELDVLMEKGAVLFESVLIHSDGARIDVEISASIVDSENRTVQAITRNITERKRTQEIMIQTEKMMTVGGMAAGMAHEINNPLAGIIQNVQVMKNRVAGDLEKNVKIAGECGTDMQTIEKYMKERGVLRMINIVVELGERAAQIVRNMLSFSRKTDAEEVSLENLAGLLNKSVEMVSSDYDLKKNYDFRKIEIVREYDKDVPSIPCIGSEIQQVFMNILTNGAHAMAEVKGERPCFILRIVREDEYCRVEIEDNGPGMDGKVRLRVFEPFFTTKKKGVGTGLGLSVSYFIVTENHSGTMSVSSIPGEGANFIIRLPLKKFNGN